MLSCTSITYHKINASPTGMDLLGRLFSYLAVTATKIENLCSLLFSWVCNLKVTHTFLSFAILQGISRAGRLLKCKLINVFLLVTNFSEHTLDS
ncbi:LOW QUALITY PROTEIN: hypothetical protein YC2023_073286 [Brassica napus]